jgi:hypothetical protein
MRVTILTIQYLVKPEKMMETSVSLSLLSDDKLSAYRFAQGINR